MGQYNGEGGYVIQIFPFSVSFSCRGTPGNNDLKICERKKVYV